MSHLWLPFTQMRHFDEHARTFVRGRGTILEDARGRCVYDAVSSIWTTIHGHCHPRIVEAIARQPEARPNIFTFFFLGVGILEAFPIIGLGLGLYLFFAVTNVPAHIQAIVK